MKLSLPKTYNGKPFRDSVILKQVMDFIRRILLNKTQYNFGRINGSRELRNKNGEDTWYSFGKGDEFGERWSWHTDLNIYVKRDVKKMQIAKCWGKTRKIIKTPKRWRIINQEIKKKKIRLNKTLQKLLKRATKFSNTEIKTWEGRCIL